LEWPREKWRIGNFTPFKRFAAVWRRSEMVSLSKTSNCVPWVEDPVNLCHWERWRVLFWIK
jgi:hypothetical protein